MKGLVKEEHLQDIANAIREKNGSTDTYKPSEMASAIREIETGGGSGEEIFFSHTGVMYQKNTIVTTDTDSSFLASLYSGCDKLETLSAPYLRSKTPTSFVFQNCTSLKSVSLPRYTRYGGQFFYNCNNVETLELGSEEYPVVDIRGSAFAGNNKLKNVYIVGNIGSEGTAYAISFAQSSLLTNESVQNIINALGDLTGKTSQTITFHANVKANMTEEQIATITGKNWTLA